MDIQHRLTAFAMVAATSIAWILAGLSVGGVAVALQRAIGLLRPEPPILFPVQSS